MGKRATIGRRLGRRSLLQAHTYLRAKGRGCRKRKNRRNVMMKPAPLERSVKVFKKTSQNVNNVENQFSDGRQPLLQAAEVATCRLPSESKERQKRRKKK